MSCLGILSGGGTNGLKSSVRLELDCFFFVGTSLAGLAIMSLPRRPLLFIHRGPPRGRGRGASLENFPQNHIIILQQV